MLVVGVSATALPWQPGPEKWEIQKIPYIYNFIVWNHNISVQIYMFEMFEAVQLVFQLVSIKIWLI